MRLRPVLVVAASAVALGLGLSLGGAEVVLKDGRTITTAKPAVVKGRMAILTLPDGSLVSIPADDVDLARTAAASSAAARPAAPEAEPAPVPKKPLTPAEAAKIKNPRRASVVLTDADVARAVDPGPDSEKGEKKNGEVSISSTSANRTKTGYSISGSATNTGKGDVRGVSVTIELVGENDKTLQTVYGNVAKDSLAPGEKSAFTAEVATAVEAKSFRYLPSWQVLVPVKAAESGPKGEPTAQTPAAAPEQAAQPAAPRKPERAEQPQPVPRPDIAPPAANAPVGAPTAPGGVYLPRPSDNQPAPPKAP